MFKTCETDFDLDQHLIPFLMEVPFFAEISRHVRKQPTEDIPTLAIAFDVVHDDVTLFWSPKFLSKLTKTQINNCLTHEFYHFVFGHIQARRKTPPVLWNIATDLAINSLIVEHARSTSKDPNTALPAGVVIPGQMPTQPDGRAFSEEEKQALPLANIIASLPILQASEWYYQKIYSDLKQHCSGAGQGDGSGEGEFGKFIDSFDDHSGWDRVPEDVREYADARIKNILEKAVKKADQSSNGWGSIPADMRAEIRASVTSVVDWRAVLRQFVASICRGARRTSMKQINRRYPYTYPGVKKGYVAKLLIAIDQSGSVDDEMLESFFGEVTALTKKVTVDVMPFDCAADVKDVFTWKKGAHPKLQRTKMGGTDFDAPSDVFNDPKNRGRWDGFLILSDGLAPKPRPSRGKRGWVIGKGRKLEFQTNEMLISLDDNASKFRGAWR